jgi:hypothetical protein
MKERSFLYGLLKFIEWYAQRDNKGLNGIDNFSALNNFSPLKLRLLPYFLCTANGNRNAMFTIFTSFFAGDEGYIENDLNPFLKEGMDFMSVFKIEKNKILITNFKLLKEQLFVLDDNGKVLLSNEAFIKEFEIEEHFVATDKINTKEQLLEHITHSIESLRKKDYDNEGGILDLSDDKLSTLSRLHFMYKMHRMGIVEYQKSEGAIKKINIDYLLTEKSVFGEKPNDRIHTPLFELMQVK